MTRHAAFVLLLLLVPVLPSAAEPGPPTPDGLTQFGVLMISAAIEPAAPHPEVPGCFAAFCDGSYFQEQIMRRTPAEILQEELDAKNFYRQRFGVDLDDPETAGRVALSKLSTRSGAPASPRDSSASVSRTTVSYTSRPATS